MNITWLRFILILLATCPFSLIATDLHPVADDDIEYEIEKSIDHALAELLDRAERGAFFDEDYACVLVNIAWERAHYTRKKINILRFLTFLVPRFLEYRVASKVAKLLVHSDDIDTQEAAFKLYIPLIDLGLQITAAGKAVEQYASNNKLKGPKILREALKKKGY